MEHRERQRLDTFFAPRHIAVVGASNRNFWFENMLANAERAGFSGTFYPVNPGAERVHGVRAYASIAELPADTIDFGVIVVRHELVMDSLVQLAARGVRHILLIASGYAETGAEGHDLQAGLQRFCRENDILLMGPNCLGFINLTQATSVFAGGSVEGTFSGGSIGIIGQSGAATETIATRVLGRGLGISLCTTTGNEAVMSAEDLFEYMVHDEHTRIITAFIEGFRDTPRLRRIAHQALQRRIPIIVLKVGRSAGARAAARSHTGALAGDDAVTDGFLRQLGIIRVETIEELVETAAAFAHLPLPAAGGLGICTLSGGLCGLYADLCERCGLELPALGDATVARLETLLPPFAGVANPLDVTGSGFQTGMDAIVASLVADKNLAVIAPVCFAPREPGDVFERMFHETLLPMVHASDKPLVPLVFREMNEWSRQLFAQHGLFYIERPALGLQALSHLMAFARRVRQGR